MKPYGDTNIPLWAENHIVGRGFFPHSGPMLKYYILARSARPPGYAYYGKDIDELFLYVWQDDLINERTRLIQSQLKKATKEYKKAREMSRQAHLHADLEAPRAFGNGIKRCA